MLTVDGLVLDIIGSTLVRVVLLCLIHFCQKNLDVNKEVDVELNAFALSAVSVDFVSIRPQRAVSSIERSRTEDDLGSCGHTPSGYSL